MRLLDWVNILIGLCVIVALVVIEIRFVIFVAVFVVLFEIRVVGGAEIGRRRARNANGHIAVCRVNDGVFLKKLEISGKKIRLVSLNPAYPPMELDATSDLQVIGIVVDQSSLA